MQTTDIDIKKAEAGMEKSKTTIQDAQTFIQELENRNIKDIDDSRLTISKDDATYIFTIDGKNLFCVQNETNLKRFLQEFYDQKKQEEVKDNEEEMTEHTTLIRINDLHIEKITSETKDELEKLKPQILSNKESYEEANDIEVIKDKTKNLINFFEKELSLAQQRKTEGSLFHPSYDKAGRAQRKLQETAIQERLTGLRALKQELATTGKKYASDNFNDQDTKITLTRFNDKLEKLGAEVPDFILQRNDIILREGNSTFYYDFNLNNVAEARTIKNQLTKVKSNLQKIDTQAYKIVGRELFIRDLERFQEYLQNIENQPDNKDLQKPFVPENKGFYNYLIQIDPTLKNYFPKQVKKTTTGTTTGTGAEDEVKKTTDNIATKTGAANEGENKPQNPERKFNSVGQSFEQGGISGMIEHGLAQTNMKPEQQQFWAGAGKLAMRGGLAFVGFKMFKSALGLLSKEGRTGDKLTSNLAWLLGPVGLTILSQSTTGDNPWSLIMGGKLTEKISSLWNGTSGKSQETLTYTQGFPGVTALFKDKSYADIAQLVEKSPDGKMRLKPSAYASMTEQAKKDAGLKSAGDFLAYIGSEDENGLVDLALTNMNMDYEKLSNPANAKTPFNETAGEAITRVGSVYTYMKEKNLNHINKESMGKIKEYIANGKPSLEELDARGDVFESTLNNLDEQTKQNVENQIKALKITDPEEEKQLRSSIYSFLNKLPANDPTKQQFTIARNRANNAIYDITTYGETTSINPQKKAFAGMESICFDTTVEALRATNLVNRIKQITKGKVADKRKAFAYNKATGDISFDGANAWYKDFDTEIVSGGRGGNLAKISPVLEANKESFVNYLNTINNFTVQPASNFTMPNLIPGAVTTTVANAIPGMSETYKPAPLTENLKKNIDTQVARLTTLSPADKATLTASLKTFVEQRPANEATKYNLKLRLHPGNSKLVDISSYEKTVTMNPSTNELTLDDMTIRFNSQVELLKAANLTNRINFFTTQMPSDTKDPFRISEIGGDIEFNGDKSWYKDFNTEMISGGRGGNLGKISPTLERNKAEYVRFLNNLGEWKGNDVIRKTNKQIRELNIANPYVKQTLIDSFYTFFQELPANEATKLLATVSINATDPNLINFNTYGITTSINVAHLTAINKLEFNSGVELLKAASLTNRLLSLAKKFGSTETEPFNISSIGGDIEFDGKNTNFFDTEMITAGTGGNLSDISETLNNNKEHYEAYLNTRRQKMPH